MKRSTLYGLITVLGINAGFSTHSTAALPVPGFKLDPERTAVVITDPQNDFLSPKGDQ